MKRRFQNGLLATLAIVFVLSLWSFNPKHTPDHDIDQLHCQFQDDLQHLFQQELHQGQMIHKSQQILRHQDLQRKNQSYQEQDLVSKILVSNPPHLGMSKTDYALNLRFGYVNWTDGKPLLKDPINYQPERKSQKAVEEFLSRKHLMDTPLDTDGLSPYLTDTLQVIAEAKRVQKNLFQDVFRGKKYVVLFALASFENKGDAALTVGELILLEQLGIKLLFYVNLRKCFRRFGHVRRAMQIAGQYPKEEVVVLMHSGGNLVAYNIVDKCRDLVFRAAEGYDQVVMPNSFWMRDTKEDFKTFIRLYRHRPNLTILLRDRMSLYMAQRLMPGVGRLVLSPDIAFQNGPVARYAAPYYDIMWQRRVDKENAIYDEVPSIPKNVSVLVWDWMNMLSIGSKNSVQKAVNVMQNGFGILQKGRVVVTDRLHGHILSTLLDIPHVLLDNADQKLSAFHNTWTRGIKNCRLADNVQDAARMALELLDEYRDSLPKRMTAVDIDENDLGEQ